MIANYPKDAISIVNWFVEMGYYSVEDLKEDDFEMIEDLLKIKESAPKFYNFLYDLSK